MAGSLKITVGIVGAFLLAVAWYFFAPTQIGGQASYVTIRGVSMEPLMHRGDLVILQKRSHYKVGEIVAYHSTDIHSVVLHRIVGRDGNRYIMRGDNTQGPDRERPLVKDFVGERWIQLDGMGAWLNRAREPKSAAFLTGLAVLLAGGTMGSGHSRRRRRPKTTTPPLPRRGHPATPSMTAGLAVAGSLGAIALLLALVSFTRAPSRQVTVPNLWQEKGVFSYQAHTKPGIAYPSGSVKTGQPVFLKLVHRLKVAFDYQASSGDPLSLSGKASLVATVTGDGGQWARSLTLSPERSFSGSAVHLAGTLNLDYLRSLMLNLQTITGVPIDSFQMTLQPQIRGSGLVAGGSIKSDFAPSYRLRLDYNQLTPETIGPSGPLTNNSPLQTQSQNGTKNEPAHLALRLYTPSVNRARELSIILLAFSLGLFVLILLRLRLRPLLDEPSEIERHYGDLLVPVGRVRDNWTDPVEVESIEALVHLAERYDRAILHVIDGGVVHHYLVEEEGSIYRYIAFENVSPSSNADEAAARARALASGAPPSQTTGPTQEP